MSEAPSPFSEKVPGLQLAWDATSLRALQFCPTYYQKSIIEGWVGPTIDLEFGILVHRAKETFRRARVAGKSKEDATLAALRVAVEESGKYVDVGESPTDMGRDSSEERETQSEEEASARPDVQVWVPWGGEYVEQWRCTGTEPYKNEKGNRAKCPYSHKGVWHIAPGPSTCSCGSPTETARRWLPANPAKDRYALVRLVAWDCDDQPEDLADGMHPYVFPDGTPAIELPFRLPLPFQTEDGENFILAGYIDAIMAQLDENFLTDVKTTKKSLDRGFFSGFEPHVGVDTYDLAGSILMPELDLQGVMIEGAQTLVGGNRFGAQLFRKSEALRAEHLEDIGMWLKLAEGFARSGKYPMAKANCWLCPFKGICSKDPDKREMYLKADFTKRKWNPLEER